MARVPAAGHGRSRGRRGDDKPGARTGKAASQASNASTSDKAASRTGKAASRASKAASRAGNASTGNTAPAGSGKAPSRAGTPREPRPGQRAPARGGRGGTGGRGGASGRRIDPARLVAFDVLRAVRERDAYANLLLPALLRERGLTGRDAALATELSYGTLRGQGTYDAVIAACSARDLDRIDPPVRDVLRLGAHQLLATRVGAHAAVATSVDLARQVTGPGATGFVNAVLRRVATRDLEAWITATAPGRAADPVGHLAIRYSHPRWIVDAISASLAEEAATGLSETEAVLAASAGRPRVALCAVPGLASQAELVAGGAEPARWSPFGAYLESGDPAAVAAVGQGRASVQDEASQLAALAPHPGGRGRPGPALARPVRRAGRQGAAAGRAGGRPERPAARRRRPPAPGAAGAGGRRPGGWRDRGRRHRARVAARVVRPCDRRRGPARSRRCSRCRCRSPGTCG